MSEDRCWVCLRITPRETLKLAHKIWFEDPKNAREIGLKSSKFIEECYVKKPIFFCGHRAKAILSGLFYLLGIQYGCRKTQREIANLMGIREVTVRKNCLRRLDSFPELFPDFRVEQAELWRDPSIGKPVPRLCLTYKGKLVKALG